MYRPDIAVGAHRREITIVSRFDGSTQAGDLTTPSALDDTVGLPLVIAPHPFGWSTDEDFAGGCDGLKAARHLGWNGVAERFGVAVVQPRGHHDVVENCSLGAAGVTADVPQWVERVAAVVNVDRARVFAVGLSMGAQEALLMAGTIPEMFAGVFGFNPVIDVAAWHDDLETATNPELRAEGGHRWIVREVGGDPRAAASSYAARSPLRVVEGLARVPCGVWWSRIDTVVPRQEECHGGVLARTLRSLGGRVWEFEHSSLHVGVDADDVGWAIHEWSDYALAVSWLLAETTAGYSAR